MDIGQVLNNIMGSIKSDSPKSLELKVGQIIKGMVLEVLGDGQALLNIGGTIVKAEVEGRVVAGQPYTLEVKSPTENTQIVLKALPTAVQDKGLNIQDLLKSFGIPVSKENVEFFQQLRNLNVPINKSTVQELQRLFNTMPKNTNPIEFATSISLLQQKSLPVSNTTVASVHSVMFGKGLYEDLNNLKSVAEHVVKNPELMKNLSTETKTLLSRLGTLFDQLDEIQQPNAQVRIENLAKNVPNVRQSGPAIPTANVDDSTTVPQHGDIAPQNGNIVPQHGDIAPQNGNIVPQNGNTPTANPKTVLEPNLPVSGPKQLDMETDPAAIEPNNNQSADMPNRPKTVLPHPTQLNKHVAVNPTTTPPIVEVPNQTQIANNLPNQEGIPNKEGMPTKSVTPAFSLDIPKDTITSVRPKEPENQSEWVRKTMSILGLENEADMYESIKKDVSVSFDRPHGTPIGKLEHMDRPLPLSQFSVDSDTATIKSTIMQLLEVKDLPEIIKTAVEDSLKSITGQQILVANDKANSPYVFTSLFLPIPNGNNGLETASVHIQARKDANGKIDKDNCRLLFDLDMQNIGHTVLDTTILNKNISLTIFNNNERMNEILENYESDLKENLRVHGYNLSIIKYSGFLKSSEVILNENLEENVKPYKGLDVKI